MLLLQNKESLGGFLMAEAKFKKMSRSHEPLYGPRKILLGGFSPTAQVKFKVLINQAGLQDVPLVWLASEQEDMLLADLLLLPDQIGWGGSSVLPRAVILSGMTENEIHRLMTLSRKTRKQATLWATITPVSENWTLKQLLHELQAERKALSQRK